MEQRTANTELSRALIALLACATVRAYAYIPKSPDPDRLWFTIAPQSPIAKGSDYTHRFEVAIPKNLAGQPVPDLDLKLEYRRVADHQTVAFVPFIPFAGNNTYPHGFSTSGMGTRDEHKKRLAELPRGEYEVAVVQGKERIRCSNVSTFVIEPDNVIEDLPVLSLAILEAPPFGTFPTVVLRVAGSRGLAEPFRYSDAVYPTLLLDSEEFHAQSMVWGGFNTEIGPGDRWIAVVPVYAYAPPLLKPGETHTLQVRVKSYITDPQSFSLNRALGDAWDAETRPFP